MTDPCKCHNSHAAVVPSHTGHCCFFPEGQTCHTEEVAAWVAEHERISND